MLLVPDLQEPLLSVSQLCDDGNTVCFTSEGRFIFNNNDFDLASLSRPAGVGERRGNLYYLPGSVGAFSASITPKLGSDNNSLLLWHQRLGHIGLKLLKTLLRTCNIRARLFNEIEVQRCSTCVQSKMHWLKFSSRSAYWSKSKGDLNYSDVCSFEEKSREGFKYWITFIDDYSKESTAYPLKYKDQAYQSFMHFKSMFEKSGHFTIKELRSDNGSEYINGPFCDFLLKGGIKHEPGPPHSPELNGVAERANRTICEKVRCLLLSSHTPKIFWVDALRHIMFTLNCVPCHTPAGFNSPNRINDTPLVELSYLRPFGCLVWYKVPEANRKKLEPKGRSSMLLSYINHGAGYHVWDLEKKCAVKTRDVVFVEDVFPYTSTLISPPSPSLPVEIEWTTTTTIPPAALPPPPRNFITPIERRLTDSMHAPANRRHAPLVPLPDSEDDLDPPLPEPPAPEPTPVLPPPLLGHAEERKNLKDLIPVNLDEPLRSRRGLVLGLKQQVRTSSTSLKHGNNY